MEYRALVNSSLEVSRLGLGSATFGREISQADSFSVLDFAIDHGINLIDTAESYGGGQSRAWRAKALGVNDVREVSDELHSSELIIGRWLHSRGRRDRILLQTKLLPPLSRKRIHEAIDASLSRLQTDYLDFYLAHAFDADTPLEETLAAFHELQQMGKIRFAGFSNFTVAQLNLALAAPGSPTLRVAQVLYNLAASESGSDLIPFCSEQGIAVQSYSPLGAGFLTGKYAFDGKIPRGSRFDVMPGHTAIYFSPDKFRMVDRLRSISAATGLPIAELAIRWILENQAVSTVLVGARKVDHIQSALNALTLHPPAELFRLYG